MIDSTSKPTEKPSKPWLGVVKYIIGFALLVAVIGLNWNSKDDGTPGLRDLLNRTPEYSLFALAMLCAVGVYVPQYLRWYVLVRALDLPFKLRDAFRLGMVGTFYSNFLPGAIGGDLVKAFYIAKGHPERKAAAVSTVVADRMLGLFGLLVFASIVGGSMWFLGNQQVVGNSKLQFIIIACAIASFLGAAGYFCMGYIPEKFATRFGERLQTWPKGQTLSELWYTGLQYRQRPKAIAMGVLLSAMSHTAMMFLFHTAARVFPPVDTSLLGSFTEHCVIAPIGFIVQAVIPLPGGLGASEFTFGGLYELIRPDGGKTVGLTARLTIRVVEWIFGGLAYIAFLNMKAELADTTVTKASREAVVAGHTV